MTAVQKAGMRTLRQGQRVAFELVNGHNGRMAAENIQSAD
ncbi:MAG: cold shock domain-containing protein [Rhodospirillales bacterium]